MYEDVSVADLQQFFLGTVAFYKDKPIKILDISETRKFDILDLLSQKRSVVLDAPKYLTSPNVRLGMLNHNGAVFYLKRVPVRRFQVGISVNNTLVNFVCGSENVSGREILDSTSLGMCMLNKYPTIPEFLAHSDDFISNASAFDKQFAVDGKRRLYYKTQKVGEVVDDKSIIFLDKFKHLGPLLEMANEANLSNFEEIKTP